MTDLPAPLTPADSDLKAFKHMPLMIERLRKSRAWLAAKKRPELGFYMVNLWSASWHETPAASVEDDDDILADLAMCDPHHWPEVKAKVLHGWVKCSDGRLYHPVIAQKANDCWATRSAFKNRLANARAIKAMKKTQPEKKTVENTQEFPEIEPVTDTRISSIIEPIEASKDPPIDTPQVSAQVLKLESQESKKESKEERKRPFATLTPSKIEGEFDLFWAIYPRKTGKGHARKAYLTAVRKADPETIAAGVKAARWPPDPQFIPHPATWLNGERWTDQPMPPAINGHANAHAQRPSSPANEARNAALKELGLWEQPKADTVPVFDAETVP